MKVAKFLPIIMLAIGLSACNKPAGELVGTYISGPTSDVDPLGMVFIRKGSFLMGANEQSAIFTQNDNNVMVSVSAFWMDAHEITNSEYRQFVHWVRDSIARTMLAEEGLEEYKIALENPVGDKDYILNWKEKIRWAERMEEGSDVANALEPLFYEDGRGPLQTGRLHYNYSWVNLDAATAKGNRFDVTTGSYPAGATVKVDSFWVENDVIKSMTITRALREPKDLKTNTIICVYPDTAVWVRDFEYSYNEPLLYSYFSMPGYSDYPVVGVTWEQAHAFCHWRTDLLRNEGKQIANQYRLPSEAEWEYAARGGRRAATYPWGDRYARDSKGCFLANFKPMRGNYTEDGYFLPSAVGTYDPNDYGLYDMAGNVAEWTDDTYDETTATFALDMNPSYKYEAREGDTKVMKRKVLKGGSWKDVGAYLQCGMRDFEYQDVCRPSIGFRCVRTHIGD